MLRCPLEKIILRLKKLDQIEKEIQTEIKVKKEELIELDNTQFKQLKIKNIFGDVTRTLATALDPPPVD